ncbi:chloramphenicol O-acetyltransferase [Pseudoalteromonas rubra]|uniref:Chloramphenicol O-acetyltransferase n=1 Tax=Pseudoalteromonas rubra TaxID=43658 RepID=A0A8T0C6Z0_9GAMM|nr:CatA-like O-acetyltransferase [Pseudoalteromonas rubra]KAF7786393.1 chloramphenicol O-acetyltransferase [Pseudoalteromonas rubra]
MKKITPSDWPRAEHFDFYLGFEQPYFNITTRLKMGTLYSLCKQQQLSFTFSYLYCLSKACQNYEPIRYRIMNNHPCVVDQVEMSCVFLREDRSFRFVPLVACDDIHDYIKENVAQKNAYLEQPLVSEHFLATCETPQQLYLSILPWLDFSSFSHARNAKDNLGIPKCVFGRFDVLTGELPFSIEVHHALMDGLHVAEFIQEIEMQCRLLCEQLLG